MMKLPAVDDTRLYELTYLLPVDLTEAETKAQEEKVIALVEKHQGKVVDTQYWGKKRLAYKLKLGPNAQTEAQYIHAQISFSAAKVPGFDRDLTLSQLVMRHLLVKADEKKVEKSSK